jgi:hypothetical protein
MLTQLSDVELRLSGIPASRKTSAEQKHQRGASIFIRLRPPTPYLKSPLKEHDSDKDDFSMISSGMPLPHCPYTKFSCLRSGQVSF